MKNYYPKYYKQFECIADKCPDSCCKGWDVVVDEKSEEIYKTLGGFGEKIRSAMTVDEDGDTVFVNKNKRCPFWNENSLCDIYIELGEEYLCKTCRRFPRIKQQYDGFCEHMLSFACPEAARLMLGCDNAYADFIGEKSELSDGLMGILLKARNTTVSYLCDRQLDFFDRLILCLEYNNAVQAFIDGEAQTICFDIDSRKNTQKKRLCATPVFELHSSLDIMSEEFISLLEKAKKLDFAPISDELQIKLERFGLYFVYRHYLTAIDTEDVITTIKRLVCACIVLARAFTVWDKSAEELFCLYSKEVEHSYENTETMEFELMTSSDFSVDSLIQIII